MCRVLIQPCKPSTLSGLANDTIPLYFEFGHKSDRRKGPCLRSPKRGVPSKELRGHMYTFFMYYRHIDIFI